MDALAYTAQEFSHARRLGADTCTTHWQRRPYHRPGDAVLAVFQEPGQRRLALARWGWEEGGLLLAHAPAAMVDQGSLAPAWPTRRCLVLATAWLHFPVPEGLPVVIEPFGPGQPFALAALWSPITVQGLTRAAVCLLTVPSCRELRTLHGEQPVVVVTERMDAWLDPTTPTQALVHLMAHHLRYVAQHSMPDPSAWDHGQLRTTRAPTARSSGRRSARTSERRGGPSTPGA
jgi:putative SOS response-associated peptidase YedK